MIHQPSLGGHIQGVSADMEIHAEQILRTKEMGARILADNTGQTVERISKDFESDYWMDAEKSIEYGIVDKIILTNCTDTDQKASGMEAFWFGAGPF
jgi:ATP-dependent Clp protease protease subunit